MARGRGAPLDLRLLVGTCLLTPPIVRGNASLSSRSPSGCCAISAFRTGWQRNRDWPAIRRALWKARDYVIPNGRGGWWLPFLLAEDPGHDAALDDLVVLVVQLPSGAAHGPVIDRRDLARLEWTRRRSSGPTSRRTRSPGGRASPGGVTLVTPASTCGAPTPGTTPS